MISNILDTIVVRFGEKEEADDRFIYRIELDAAKNGLTEEGRDKTTFYPGESIWVRAQFQPGYTLEKITNTDGMVINQGFINHEKLQERVFFPDDEETTLDFYTSSEVAAAEFLGRVGSIVKLSPNTVKCSSPPVICNLDYNFSGYSIEIIPPSLTLGEGETYPIGIVLWVSKI